MFELGRILVYIAFGASVSASIFYFSSLNKDSFVKIGRWSYYLMTVTMLGISMWLLSNILQNNFQYTYIWEYSSKELPTNLLISTFYAGQQGSFLLWGLMLTLIGYFLIPYARDKGYESSVMGVYSLILLFILLILIFKSPFDFVWETYTDQNIEPGFMPENGRGLNPVLQNYWINIHPPILFLGYSAMSVPYAFAIAGLIKKDYRKWIRLSLPWTLFAAGVLGLGLMLGGLWAYETLGWGGFWAWDPVENSSLIPWLVAVTLIHTMYINQKTGGLVKTNFIFSTLSFLLVLYATFLTRSGVLGDTSVHSFVSPGPVVYKLLIIFMVTFALVAFVALILRLRKIPNPRIDFNLSSKEFIVSLGSIVLTLITFIVLIGTSWPVITELLGMTKSSIEVAWYNKLNLPLAILIMIFNSVSLYLSWRKTKNLKLVKKSTLAIILGFIVIITGIALGVRDFNHLIVLFAVGFSVYINSEFLIKIFSKNGRLVGGYLAHIGFALLILGALASGAYSVDTQIRLKEGETKEFRGYEISYESRERIEKYFKDREKYRYNISVKDKDGSESIVHPVVYWSDFNDRQSPFFEPGISRYLAKDIYISPYSIEPYYDVEPIFLQKGKSAPMSLDSSYKIQMLDFKMTGMREATKNGERPTSMQIGAMVRISTDNFVKEDTIKAKMNLMTGGTEPEWYTIEDTDYQIGFMQIIPDKENLSNSQAVFAFKTIDGEVSQAKELFTFEVSTKPFINIVWIGTIILVFGFFISIFKYTTPKKIREVVDNDDEIKNVETESSSV